MLFKISFSVNLILNTLEYFFELKEFSKFYSKFIFIYVICRNFIDIVFYSSNFFPNIGVFVVDRSMDLTKPFHDFDLALTIR